MSAVDHEERDVREVGLFREIPLSRHEAIIALHRLIAPNALAVPCVTCDQPGMEDCIVQRDDPDMPRPIVHEERKRLAFETLVGALRAL